MIQNSNHKHCLNVITCRHVNSLAWISQLPFIGFQNKSHVSEFYLGIIHCKYYFVELLAYVEVLFTMNTVRAITYVVIFTVLYSCVKILETHHYYYYYYYYYYITSAHSYLSKKLVCVRVCVLD